MPPRRIYEHSGPAELVLEGENLTPDTLKLYHNGVLYTPLVSSDTYAYYLLGDNGTNKIMLNGSNFCTVVVKDIVVPSWLPALLSMVQDNLGGENFSAGVNQMAITGNCINYPFLYDADHKYFDLAINQPQSLDLEVDDFTFENCSSVTFGYFYSRWRVKLEVTDTTKPAYITYQGFIIAVFNYTA